MYIYIYITWQNMASSRRLFNFPNTLFSECYKVSCVLAKSFPICSILHMVHNKCSLLHLLLYDSRQGNCKKRDLSDCAISFLLNVVRHRIRFAHLFPRVPVFKLSMNVHILNFREVYHTTHLSFNRPGHCVT